MCAADHVHSIEAEVRQRAALGAGMHRLRLVAPEVAAGTRPGAFVMIGFADRTHPLLSRPFAVFDAVGDGTIDVLFKEVGRGTRELARVTPGQKLRLVGPLGRGWRIDGTARGLIVAGGTGIAAVHLLAKALVAGGAEVCMVWGQPGREGFPESGALDVPGARLELATDDGSCGHCGTSVDCIAEVAPRDRDAAATVVYGAGPLPMLKALSAWADERGLACQVSLEARMACGVGVCRACVVNARTAHPDTGLHRRAVCVDGPVFDAHEVDWEAPR
jgi:dihydroorotate dehydrogenase electron transfer subunit